MSFALETKENPKRRKINNQLWYTNYKDNAFIQTWEGITISSSPNNIANQVTSFGLKYANKLSLKIQLLLPSPRGKYRKKGDEIFQRQR